MSDLELVRDAYLEVISDPAFHRNMVEAEDGEEVWMLFNLVPSSAGTYQCSEILEYLGFDSQGNDDDIEFAEEMTDAATRCLNEDLMRANLSPKGARLAYGWWPEGCWGLVIYKDES